MLIEWSDSRQPTNARAHLADIGKRTPVECVSVGFLIQDDDDVKVLAANMGDIGEEMQATGVITIPTVAVHAVKPLIEAYCYFFFPFCVKAEAATDLIFAGVLGLDKRSEAMDATRLEVVSFRFLVTSYS